MNLGLRSNVDADRRSIEKQHFGIGQEPASDDHAHPDLKGILGARLDN
jgi:hypothetical protein